MRPSKQPSFGRIFVYVGITLKFLIQSSGSPLLADYYRGRLSDEALVKENSLPYIYVTVSKRANKPSVQNIPGFSTANKNINIQLKTCLGKLEGLRES